MTTIATGLNNPRGLAFGPNGNLYVAEAGLGAGDGHGGFGVGIGFTGSITEIREIASPNPISRRVVTGLASVGFFPSAIGRWVEGADGISIHGEGGMYVIMSDSSEGLELDPTDPAAAQFGHLLKATPGGQWKATADVGNFNFEWTDQNQSAPFAPPGQFPDANPYGVLALPGHQYVVDAGANTLNEVRANGSVRIVAYFPNPPVSDAVPTCVAMGPDGFLYVGTLGALRFRQGQVYRVNPTSQDIQFLTSDDVWADDFTAITGCGFGPGGFYVTEFFTSLPPIPPQGDVVRIAINADGSAGTRTYLGSSALHVPNGFAAGPDGAIYVSDRSINPGGGMVVRVEN